MTNSEVRIRLGEYLVVFARAGGGFPTYIGFAGPDGEEAVVRSDRPWLSVGLADGSAAVPVWPEQYRPEVVRVGDATRVEFQNLRWQRGDGERLERFGLTLRYEFWPDGACFVRSFFTVEGSSPPDLVHFRLRPPLCIPAGNEISWSCWDRPDSNCANLIQALGGVKRFQSPGTDLVRDGSLLPYIGFDFGSEGRRDKHMEWFLEGANSLSPDPGNTRTSLQWEGQTPRLEWDFLREQRSSPQRPWQWRNQWGWTLCRAPRRRRHAPLRMYHYFDGAKPYPTDRQIEKMAAEGADLLVLHELWRTDPQNGETPSNLAEFRRVTEAVRRCNLRLALYVRGNEPSIREDRADWFDQLLRRDHDGLYIDFGTPICYSVGIDEIFPGGRIAFREYYLVMRALRERVGDRGILLSHSGPFFAACGMAGLIDGYVAGEGERGVLISGQTEHAYFSGISVAPPTMWTAAFPDYRSSRALPFLASVGQAPHVALGTQIASSSLQHPVEPAAVAFARPLWKLWGILRGQHDLGVVHQQNSQGVFATDSPQTVACLFQAADGSALLLAANLAATAREVEVTVNWKNMGVMPEQDWTAVFLDPQSDPPSVKPVAARPPFIATLPGYGVAGWLLTAKPEAWRAPLDTFRESYPEPDEDDRKYGQEIESLRKLRFSPRPHRRLFVRFAVPENSVAYEDSLWWDLYDIQNVLVRLLPDGQQERLGFVSAKGMVSAAPEKTDFIWPGVGTPWIALHDLLPPGRHDLALLSIHQGEPFYSFVTAEFTTDPASQVDRHVVRFANELDSDRSRLSFAVDLCDRP